MKSIFSILALSAALAVPANANNILIYKVASSESYTDFNVDNPTLGTAKGTGPIAGSDTYTEYYVIDLNAQSTAAGKPGKYVNIYFASDSEAIPVFDNKNNATTSKKFMYGFDSLNAEDLGTLLGHDQPLKTAANYLWNSQRGLVQGNDHDFNGDNVTDASVRVFETIQGKGVATPLVLTPMVTIPSVARTFVQKDVSTRIEEVKVGFPNDVPPSPPYISFEKKLVTKTWTLDTTLTKLANTVDVTGTADLSLAGTVAKASFNNGIQRVHDFLYSQGYRVVRP